MKKFGLVLLTIMLILVSCNNFEPESIKKEGLYTTYNQLVIKTSSAPETYYVFGLSNGNALTGSCKSYMFYGENVSLSSIKKTCKEMNDTLYVRKCTQSGRTLIIEWDEFLWGGKGFTKNDVISAYEKTGGKVVYR